jgi:hypothetical protein
MSQSESFEIVTPIMCTILMLAFCQNLLDFFMQRFDILQSFFCCVLYWLWNGWDSKKKKKKEKKNSNQLIKVYLAPTVIKVNKQSANSWWKRLIFFCCSLMMHWLAVICAECCTLSVSNSNNFLSYYRAIASNYNLINKKRGMKDFFIDKKKVLFTISVLKHVLSKIRIWNVKERGSW